LSICSGVSLQIAEEAAEEVDATGFATDGLELDAVELVDGGFLVDVTEFVTGGLEVDVARFFAGGGLGEDAAEEVTDLLVDSVDDL
jgi:hypothetical protein